MLSADALRAEVEKVDREHGRSSTFYLAKNILGYELLEHNPHIGVCAFADDIVATFPHKGLDLEPRGNFKTTIFSQALPIRLLINNPNLRILLDSAVLQNSIDNLRVIKGHFEGNEKLRYLFGDYVGSYWTTEEVTVKKRTVIKKEPSIRCASVERVQVGPHYDVIIADDLVSDENSATPEGREKVKNHLRLLISLLEPGGVLILVGTRWHYEDAYGLIIDTLKDFKVRIKSAETGGPDKTLYFPKRFPKVVLDSIRDIQGRDIYNCQYLNDPAPEDPNAKFQRSTFQRYETPPTNVNAFITVDPGGAEKGSDEWVLLGALMDEDSRELFDRLRHGNWKLSEALDHLFELHALMAKVYGRVMAVGLETTGGQKWVLEALNAEMRRRQTYLNVIPLPHAGKSKASRIETLIPRYTARAVLHSAEMAPLEEQLVRYPRGKDDIADAASMVSEVAFPPRRARQAEPPPKSVEEWLMREALKGRAVRHVHSMLGSHY